MKWLEKIKSLLNITQKNSGQHGVQIGHVAGNVTVLNSAREAAQEDVVTVKSLVRKVPWKPVCAFMDKTFSTRQIEALDKHQLYRLRRYVETMIERGNVRRQSAGDAS